MAIAFSFEQFCDVVCPTRIVGMTTEKLSNIGSLDTAKAGDVAFLGNDKYHSQVETCNASVILLPNNYEGSEPKANQAYVFVEKPSYVLAMICAQIEQALWPKPPAGIHPTAIVPDSVVCDAGVHIGAYVVLGENVKIGKNTVISSGVTIGNSVVIGEDCHFESGVRIGSYSVLGNRIHILPNAVIGADGFGFIPVDGKIEKIPQIGNVVIDDDVEIGASSCVDRARFSSTKIGKGTKIDNLVQIGHNCEIGKYCFLCGQVGLAGSTIIGDYVTLAGQVGVGGHLKIGDKAIVGAQAGVLGNIDAGAVVIDSPAMPAGLGKKYWALKSRLPDMYKQLKSIEKKLSENN